MKTRLVQFVFVLIAAALLVWGEIRAANRGENAAKRWVPYTTAGLVVLTGINIAVQSRGLASVLLAVSSLLLALVLAAAVLGRAEGSQHSTGAVVRATIFFALLIVTACLQMRSPQSQTASG